MTRILQIRRGTAAQNDTFTGLIGEITMDTDAKTLRVHDGETQGGFTLARTNGAATGAGTFNITTVPDEFWADIVAKHSTPGFTMIETKPVPINSHASRIDYVLNTHVTPRVIQCALICQNSDAGYNVGDEVWAFGVGTRTNPSPNYELKDDGLHLYFMVGQTQYWVSHKTTGVTTNVTDDNWRILFRVYY